MTIPTAWPRIPSGRADGSLHHRIKKEDFHRKSTQGESIVLKTDRAIKNTQPFSLQNKDSQITRLLTITISRKVQAPN